MARANKKKPPGGPALTPAQRAALSSNLKRLRIQAKLTQDEVAHLAGCSAGQVKNIEQKLSARPGFNLLRMLARAVQAEFEELVRGV